MRPNDAAVCRAPGKYAVNLKADEILAEAEAGCGAAAMRAEAVRSACGLEGDGCVWRQVARVRSDAWRDDLTQSSFCRRQTSMCYTEKEAPARHCPRINTTTCTTKLTTVSLRNSLSLDRNELQLASSFCTRLRRTCASLETSATPESAPATSCICGLREVRSHANTHVCSHILSTPPRW